MSNGENKYLWKGQDLESFSTEEIGRILETQQKEMEYQQDRISDLEMDKAMLEAQVREYNRTLEGVTKSGGVRPKTPIGALVLFWIMTLSLVIIAGIELISLHQWLNGF